MQWFVIDGQEKKGELVIISPEKDTGITDPELMLKIQHGDERAFETLVKRHEDRVFHLAYRILGRREDSRDVAQDVFIKLWDNPRAWKPTAAFTTWLYRVTTNLALNKKRNLKIKSFFSLSDLEEFQHPESPEPSADEELVNAEKTDRFEKELNLLNPRQRTALYLRYREELPVAEVAKVLGVSLKSAESLIFRGKKTLRDKLKT